MARRKRVEVPIPDTPEWVWTALAGGEQWRAAVDWLYPHYGVIRTLRASAGHRRRSLPDRDPALFIPCPCPDHDGAAAWDQL